MMWGPMGVCEAQLLLLRMQLSSTSLKLAQREAPRRAGPPLFSRLMSVCRMDSPCWLASACSNHRGQSDR